MPSSFGSNSLGEQKRRRVEYLVGLVCTSASVLLGCRRWKMHGA